VPIGYTTAVTPMQMLDVFTTVANGGMSVPPRRGRATIGADGTRKDVPRQKGKRVISATTADQLNQMLRSVVTDGTGEQAAISGYTVAGKTGTSAAAVRADAALHGELRRLRARRVAAVGGDRRHRPAGHEQRGVLRRQGGGAALLDDHAVRAAPRARSADHADGG
jgi:cell division protein FtsI/penicillin-binding protein 2